jgi:hypothetical protein
MKLGPFLFIRVHLGAQRDVVSPGAGQGGPACTNRRGHTRYYDVVQGDIRMTELFPLPCRSRPRSSGPVSTDSPDKRRRARSYWDSGARV